MTGSTPPSTPDGPAKTVPPVNAALVTWAPLALVSATIFLLSNEPALGEPNVLAAFLHTLLGGYAWYEHMAPGIDVLDTLSSWLAHFVEYMLLTVAALWAVRRQWPSYAHPYLAAFAFASLYALSDELHQNFVPGRHSDWRDVATDMAGALFALTVVRVLRRRRSQPVNIQP